MQSSVRSDRNGTRHFLHLPSPPSQENGPVKAWSQPVSMPTYLPARADHNPMFLEKRVYQGSSGRVYPLPFIDRICYRSYRPAVAGGTP